MNELPHELPQEWPFPPLGGPVEKTQKQLREQMLRESEPAPF